MKGQNDENTQNHIHTSIYMSTQENIYVSTSLLWQTKSNYLIQTYTSCMHIKLSYWKSDSEYLFSWYRCLMHRRYCSLALNQWHILMKSNGSERHLYIEHYSNWDIMVSTSQKYLGRKTHWFPENVSVICCKCDLWFTDKDLYDIYLSMLAHIMFYVSCLIYIQESLIFLRLL